jgi:hypothetical protein
MKEDKILLKGHAINWSDLDSFIGLKSSPHFLTSLINNVALIARDDTLDMLEKKKGFRLTKGLLMLILICAVCLILGAVVILYLPNITAFFQGIF